MKQLTIGIFHDDHLAQDLGKKATESDMILYHRKFDDLILSFIHPVEDKLTVKTQIMGIIDVAILSAETITPAFGETLLMLNALGIKQGFIIVRPFSDTAPLKTMIKDTTLEHFEIIEKNHHVLLEKLQNISVQRNTTEPCIVTIDHSFPVKGIGEVILGFINQGTIHTHDKLMLQPANKEIIVRSIQMQDKDEKQAPAGSRVGLAIKGADITELSRGALLCQPHQVMVEKEITLTFQKNSFYQQSVEGKYHATTGMQTIPITIHTVKNDSITFTADKPFCYTPDSVFFILNLNAEKLHFIGSGTPLR